MLQASPVLLAAVMSPQWALAEPPSSVHQRASQAPIPAGTHHDQSSRGGTRDDKSAPPSPIVIDVHGRRAHTARPHPRSRVTRAQLDEQIPLSSPAALTYEPGVFVQQTAHGQASVFVRGHTGQQTLLLFDGIRLNTSTYRQGPNQYFFTVDSQSIHHIDVVRGGASTRFGSDAIGGVIEAAPLEPRLDLAAKGWKVRPRSILRYSSPDHAFGERFVLDTQVSPKLRVLTGVGYRRVGELRSGGIVTSPTTGQPALVPTFESDGKTQRGTGFNELTGDTRVVWEPNDHHRFVAAAYAYREFDAPRTDQCPAAFAPRDECLMYQEQYRTLTYVKWNGRQLGKIAKQLSATASFQRQHERRQRSRPGSFINNGGRDDVNTFGLTLKGKTGKFPLSKHVAVLGHYGADAYRDTLQSDAWTEFTDSQRVIPSSRGMYLSGSAYTQAGAFIDPILHLGDTLSLRAGGRLSAIHATAPADAQSGTSGVDQTWTAPVAHAGISWFATPWLTWIANIDRSFRAPNLDDLTSRQQTGPGFQFENPSLEPEYGDTLETGLHVAARRLTLDLWAFHSVVHQAITRVARSATDCPAGTPQCQSSWSRFQLVNAPGLADIDGVEVSGKLKLPGRVRLSSTFTATRGELDNPEHQSSDPTIPFTKRVPLSRIPPINGTARATWHPMTGLYVGAGMRWALRQDRLAPSDLSDARIPAGGTPGFAVFDLLAGYHIGRNLQVNVVVDNVADTAYRNHGSSVNGPGRGVMVRFASGL